MEIKLDPKQIATAFVYTVLALVFLNGFTLALYFYFSEYDLYVLSDYFDFGVEGNIPTFYSAFAIMMCSGLLALITRAKWRQPDGKRGYWLGLTLIFFYLAFDEAAAIHEWLSNFMDTFMTGEGFLYYLWVLPYGAIVLVVGLIYLDFVWSLPKPTRFRFIASGVIFLSGAVGFEMISARSAEEYGTDTVMYSLLYSIEETLEMFGIVLFLYALLSYLANEIGGVVVELRPTAAESSES